MHPEIHTNNHFLLYNYVAIYAYIQLYVHDKTNGNAAVALMHFRLLCGKPHFSNKRMRKSMKMNKKLQFSAVVEVTLFN